jgi:hypothetical protein
LDFNPNQKIREGIESAAKGYLPISREKLKEENDGLYILLRYGTREEEIRSGHIRLNSNLAIHNMGS